MRDFNLRELQLSELDILKEVDRICKKHNIKYYLSWGTALGAVRHQGFIPWDDDIDISMLPEDYLKFKEVCKTDMKEPYFYQDWDTDPYYHCSWAKVRNSNTTSMMAEMKDYPIHWGVCIDVFPLFYLPKDHVDRFTAFCVKLMNITTAKPLDNYGYCFTRYAKYTRMIPTALCNKIKRMCFKKLIGGNSNYPSVLTDVAPQRIEPSCNYGETILVKFEDGMFPINKEYHASLTHAYGDYMKIPEIHERIDHGNIIVDLANGYTMYTEIKEGRNVK